MSAPLSRAGLPQICALACLLMLGCTGPKQEKPRERTGIPGISVAPNESYTGTTGEARTPHRVSLRLEFVLLHEPIAERYFRGVYSRISEVVRFVVASFTAEQLRTRAGRELLAERIADNVNEQAGRRAVYRVLIVDLQLRPAR